MVLMLFEEHIEECEPLDPFLRPLITEHFELLPSNELSLVFFEAIPLYKTEVFILSLLLVSLVLPIMHFSQLVLGHGTPLSHYLSQ